MSTGLSHWEKRETRETGLVPAVDSPLLTIAELIAYVRLSQSTIYDRLEQFEVVRLGRRIFVTKVSADAYIAANTRRPTKPLAPPKRRRRDLVDEVRSRPTPLRSPRPWTISNTVRPARRSSS